MKTKQLAFLLLIVMILMAFVGMAQTPEIKGPYRYEDLSVSGRLGVPNDTTHAKKVWQTSLPDIVVINDSILMVWSVVLQRYVLPKSSTSASVGWADIIGSNPMVNTYLANLFNAKQNTLPTGTSSDYIGGDHYLHNLDSFLTAHNWVNKSDSQYTTVIAGGQSLQRTTDIGNITTNSVNVINNAFNVTDGSGNLISSLFPSSSTYGSMSLMAGSTTAYSILKTQTMTSSNFLYTPNTGNIRDTLVTAWELRSAIGSAPASNLQAVTDVGATTTHDLTIGNATLGQGAYANTGNKAFGKFVLGSNVSGTKNIGIGDSAMMSITSGNFNVALGYQAGRLNQTGNANVGVGQWALEDNVSGGSNTAVGHSALGQATGSNNTAVGSNAGANLTTGIQNTIIGYTNQLVTTGNYNTIIGTAGTSGTHSNMQGYLILANGQFNNRLIVDSVGLWKIGTYGTGTHAGTAAYNLAIDASGNMIEVAGGGGSTKFGKSGEDATAAEDRTFTYSGHFVRLIDNTGTGGNSYWRSRSSSWTSDMTFASGGMGITTNDYPNFDHQTYVGTINDGSIPGAQISSTGPSGNEYLFIYETGIEIKSTVSSTATRLKLSNLPVYADESAATTGGLATGIVYRTSTGELRIKL